MFLWLIAGVAAALGAMIFIGFVRSLAAQYRENPRRLEYHALHLLLWAASIGSLSGCFATYRRLSGEQPNPHPVVNVVLGLVYLVILVGGLLVLGFFMYREDHRSGKLVRRLKLYDRFL